MDKSGKRLLAVMLVGLLVCGGMGMLGAVPAAVAQTGDDGTTNWDFIVPVTHQKTVPAGYTAIRTATELNNIRNGIIISGNTYRYILMNDIDLSSWTNWEPIQSAVNATVELVKHILWYRQKNIAASLQIRRRNIFGGTKRLLNVCIRGKHHRDFMKKHTAPLPAVKYGKIPLKVKSQQKGELSTVFDNDRYITRGIEAEIPPKLQLFLWHLIDLRQQAEAELDYLQVFRLSNGKGVQKIIHTQEQPPYQDKAVLLGVKPIVEAKIYVIDDGNHSTMLYQHYADRDLLPIAVEAKELR